MVNSYEFISVIMCLKFKWLHITDLKSNVKLISHPDLLYLTFLIYQRRSQHKLIALLARANSGLQ